MVVLVFHRTTKRKIRGPLVSIPVQSRSCEGRNF